MGNPWEGPPPPSSPAGCGTCGAGGGPAAPVAVVTQATDATIEYRGTTIKAVPGTPIPYGAVVKTGPRGAFAAKVVNQDQTFSFGGDTSVPVDDYLVAPPKGDLKGLGRGRLNVISGAISKLKPDPLQLTSPAGALGVRG